MKLALVGVGSAGGRIIDQLVDSARAAGRSFCRGDVLLFETTSPGVEAANISEGKRVVIGDTHPDVRGTGVDGDPDLGAAVAREDLSEIRRAFDAIELYDVDAILLVAGLGGGTGAGVGSVILEEIRGTYEIPVYCLGALPADEEGDRRAVNAARALRTFVPRAENVLLFDNEAWRTGPEEEWAADRLEAVYDRMNRELADRVVGLFAAGELETGDVSENLLDPSDTMRTLSTRGVSTIGHASIQLESRVGGLLSWLFFWRSVDGAEPTDALQIKELVETAVESKLTLPCDVRSTDRAMFVLSGPPQEFSRKGFEAARYWLEERTGTVEVMAGDEPNASARHLSVTVLLSNVTDVPRIEELQERAVAAIDVDLETVDGQIADSAEPTPPPEPVPDAADE